MTRGRLRTITVILQQIQRQNGRRLEHFIQTLSRSVCRTHDAVRKIGAARADVWVLAERVLHHAQYFEKLRPLRRLALGRRDLLLEPQQVNEGNINLKPQAWRSM